MEPMRRRRENPFRRDGRRVKGKKIRPVPSLSMVNQGAKCVPCDTHVTNRIIPEIETSETGLNPGERAECQEGICLLTGNPQTRNKPGL